jgi:hypothetical protein
LRDKCSAVLGCELTSYVIGGEVRHEGVGMVAITAFIVSWVTVGIIQLPAEAVMLGKRFAIVTVLTIGTE